MPAKREGTMTDPELVSESCACCGSALRAMFDRRRFLRGAGAAGLLTAAPGLAIAAPKYKFEAMVLSCIDPRFQKPVFKAMTERGLKGQYSKFTVAGASIGVVAPAFKKWHKTFWDNLGASVELHSITKVIAINHRDCGAAKIAYGKEKLATRDGETEVHRAAMAEFRKQVAEKQPKLGVETYLMSLDGKMETLA
jgi:carbonic anhydrase